MKKVGLVLMQFGFFCLFLTVFVGIFALVGWFASHVQPLYLAIFGGVAVACIIIGMLWNADGKPSE